MLYDGLGSVVALTNTSGTVVGHMAYDAVGKVFSQSGTQGRYGFTGRPLDGDIGLQYNRARFYDASSGRWNRADEYRGEIMVPASLQRYVCVYQNPVNKTDPSGLSDDDPPQWFVDFLTTFADPLIGMLTTWLEVYFKNGKSYDAIFQVRAFGGGLGIMASVLITILSVVLIMGGTDSALCKGIKSAIVVFWSVIFFVIAAELTAFFIPVAGFALILGISFVNSFIVTRWFRAVESVVNCGC
jgi:RHS repeat-associated protein